MKKIMFCVKAIKLACASAMLDALLFVVGYVFSLFEKHKVIKLCFTSLVVACLYYYGHWTIALLITIITLAIIMIMWALENPISVVQDPYDD